MLSTLIALPLLGALLLTFVDSAYVKLIRIFALALTVFIFWYSVNLIILFDNSLFGFQFLEYFKWNFLLNIEFQLGVDGLSIYLIILTTFIMPVCLLVAWSSINNFTKEYIISFLILEGALLAVFMVLDLFLFYIVFEATLLPMFFIVGIWGSRSRRINAAYFLFLYTLLGSVFMFIAILYIWVVFGTTDYTVLSTFKFDETEQFFLWLAFFLSFAVKIPMFPFHIWLPEAHVEAPTSGSVILAGVLLKLGGYGFLRFSLILFPEACSFFIPFTLTLSVLSIVYASLTTLQQVDLKKIIAYSSVAHMGFVTMGIFSLNSFGVEGSIMLMLSHGLVSSGLFLCVGVLYDRFHTRVVKNFSGLVSLMPIFSTIFLILSLANLGLPLTSSFIGEFLVLISTFQISVFASFIGIISMVLGAAYTLWLANRVCFGNLKTAAVFPNYDLSRREFFMLVPFVVLVIFLGIFPGPLLNSIHVFSIAIL